MAKPSKPRDPNGTAQATAKLPQPRKRAARGTGEQQIVAAAIEFFAEEGFRASTRELAGRIGVTQALLYRYFSSKQALIDRVFVEVFVEDWDDENTCRLIDGKGPLAKRLTAFYQAFAHRSSRQRLRLFLRAELDNQEIAGPYTRQLNDRILIPVVCVLRREAKLPPPSETPILEAERELAMTLHSAVVHLNMRKHIYDSPLPDDLGQHIAFYVNCYLAGALPSIKGLHKSRPQGMLGMTLPGIDTD